MRTTIDAAGRLVIPERFDAKPGSSPGPRLRCVGVTVGSRSSRLRCRSISFARDASWSPSPRAKLEPLRADTVERTRRTLRRRRPADGDRDGGVRPRHELHGRGGLLLARAPCQCRSGARTASGERRIHDRRGTRLGRSLCGVDALASPASAFGERCTRPARSELHPRGEDRRARCAVLRHIACDRPPRTP